MTLTKFALAFLASVSVVGAARADPITDGAGEAGETRIEVPAPGGTAVPAPGALWLFAAGLAALGLRYGRRR